MGSITAREKAAIIDFIGIPAVFFEPGGIERLLRTKCRCVPVGTHLVWFKSSRIKKRRDTLRHLALYRAERI